MWEARNPDRSGSMQKRVGTQGGFLHIFADPCFQSSYLSVAFNIFNCVRGFTLLCAGTGSVRHLKTGLSSEEGSPGMACLKGKDHWAAKKPSKVPTKPLASFYYVH